MGLNDINSLAHTKWNCKYHIVFAPKYRRRIFYGEKRIAIGKILRQLCEWKGVNIIEAEVCPVHRPCTHAAGDTAKIFSINRDGISEGEKQHNDL